jgi:hypothetical protein
LIQADLSQTVDICAQAFNPAGAAEREALSKKLAETSMLDMDLNDDERRILTTMRTCNVVRTDDLANFDNFRVNVIDGMVLNLKRGEVTLTPAPVPVARAGDAGLSTADPVVKNPMTSNFSC